MANHSTAKSYNHENNRASVWSDRRVALSCVLLQRRGSLRMPFSTCGKLQSASALHRCIASPHVSENSLLCPWPRAGDLGRSLQRESSFSCKTASGPISSILAARHLPPRTDLNHPLSALP